MIRAIVGDALAAGEGVSPFAVKRHHTGEADGTIAIIGGAIHAQVADVVRALQGGVARQ